MLQSFLWLVYDKFVIMILVICFFMKNMELIIFLMDTVTRTGISHMACGFLEHHKCYINSVHITWNYSLSVRIHNPKYLQYKPWTIAWVNLCLMASLSCLETLISSYNTYVFLLSQFLDTIYCCGTRLQICYIIFH